MARYLLSFGGVPLVTFEGPDDESGVDVHRRAGLAVVIEATRRGGAQLLTPCDASEPEAWEVRREGGVVIGRWRREDGR